MKRVSPKAMFFVVIAIGSVLVMPACNNATGPWKAQVVDAETEEPMQGVIVLAVWFKYTASAGGWAAQEYYASEEVVTGPDGRFIILNRSTFSWPPFLTTVKGPEFWMFKPGYGRWRFQGSDEWLKLPHLERESRVKTAWKHFTGNGVAIELPPAKAREKRLQMIGRPSGLIPDEHMKKYLEALERERINLGLRESSK